MKKNLIKADDKSLWCASGREIALRHFWDCLLGEAYGAAFILRFKSFLLFAF